MGCQNSVVSNYSQKKSNLSVKSQNIVNNNIIIKQKQSITDHHHLNVLKITNSKNKNTREQVNFQDQVQSNKYRIFSNNKSHSQTLANALQQCSSNKSESAQLLADRMFSLGFIDQAIQIYQRIIQFQPTKTHPTQGLGNYQSTLNYYNHQIYLWYSLELKKGLIKSSPYDKLSLCYCVYQDNKSISIERGLLWYKKMAQKYTNNYQILIGYGNLLYRNGQYKKANKVYSQVSELRPDLIQNMVSLMFIQHYYQKNNQFSLYYADKIIELTNNNNYYAGYIKSLTIDNSDDRIKSLKQNSQKHPQCPFICIQIGINYMKNKAYKKAMLQFKKCIQTSPSIPEAYINIGCCQQQQKNYKQSCEYFYKVIEIDHTKKQIYYHLIQVYKAIKYTQEQIQTQINKRFNKLDKGVVFNMLAQSFIDHKIVDRAVFWVHKAINTDCQNYIFYYTYAKALQVNNCVDQAILNYRKSVELNPQFTKGYQKLALIYNKLKDINLQVKWYKKLVQIDPTYIKCYQNLGSYHECAQQYLQTIDSYQKPTKLNTNFAQGLIKFSQYLTTDPYKNSQIRITKLYSLQQNTNQLSLIRQLSEHKTQDLNIIEKQNLNNLEDLMKDFRGKLCKDKHKEQANYLIKHKIFNPNIIDIIHAIQQHKFQLSMMQSVFKYIQNLFITDQQYFHIVPLLFIQYFQISVFERKKSIIQVEEQISKIMINYTNRIAQKHNKPSLKVQKSTDLDFNLTYCKPTGKKIDLFCLNNISSKKYYMSDYNQLYVQVNKANKLGKQNFIDFALLVRQVRIKSFGISQGIGLKIPNRSSDQFKVIVRIMEKMFKQQMNQQRKIKIIKTVSQNISTFKLINFQNVVMEFIKVWNNEITNILLERKKNKIQTKCYINDLLRAKCVFRNIDDLHRAVRETDKYCRDYGFTIIELDNRLSKPQTQDVVFKIQVKNAVCEFQLALNQQSTVYHLNHAIYQILRSPLGCIFGSQLYLSKQFKYHFGVNCKDIKQLLLSDITQGSNIHQKQQIKNKVEYVLSVLNKENIQG